MLNVPALQETTVSGEKMVSPLPYSGPQDGLFPVLAMQGQRWLHPPSSGHGVVLLAGVSGCVQSDQCTSWDNHHMVHSTQHLPALPWVPSPWGEKHVLKGAQWAEHDLDV